jgi:deoxyribodipyrimidine photo-lyase
MKQESYGIHWFRRDLRIAGNSAFRENYKKNKQQVLGVFCFDSDFLSRSDFSHNRFAFFLSSLKELQKELKEIGSELLVLDDVPRKAFPKIFEFLNSRKIPLPQNISFNRDYEPFARERDAEITNLLEEKWGLSILTERDHLIIEPRELFKDKPASYYQVYTPFSKKWLSLFQEEEFKKRVSVQKESFEYLKKREQKKIEPILDFSLKKLLKSNFQDFPYADALDSFIEKNNKKVSIPIPKAGSLEALQYLYEFKNKIDWYGAKRDFPAVDGTSKFSLFLKNGSLTSAQIFYFFEFHKKIPDENSGAFKFLKEILWREFYVHILFHEPRVEKEAFIKKYNSIRWNNKEEFFEAWKNGETGYPIVDAGMRELNETGWMHNRVRMIVASFLTKDLLIDWKWGEKYFMEKLLDGDLAPNNGGWQWAASTGCDPQPYFRIFNPKLQSEKFDEKGDYIKKYIPELKGLTSKEIHEPHSHREFLKYPQPIVDHAKQKEKALALYKIE